MKRFVTQYALTTGIEEVEAHDAGHGMIGFYADGYTTYISKAHHFATRDDAETKAEEMRRKKLEGLRQQIVKLEQLKF